ncbi:alpha-D-ribose 1-methylphosphonate 5-triphosphate diphosphatase [Pararhodobacter zhoushanensis]|uniref:alpha-D-ribose 1-methylphosphonate 5-triphosphate diphosphatase n=1 Tax=Pararhodobacter zhoushanensis TaxID=2479545 RepID=UPI000F8E805E|nr:alpha-D-ribose 1-methylphosphonate 5-triphosphate diphosphatase [Pararhodobacter zhoushanensis]
MPLLPPIRLTGARVLNDAILHDAPLTLADGHITDGPARAVDLSGFLLLPGIVDLHGDGFERHLTPRPAAPFDKARALRSVAAELAANGVTTAWLAQSWSWEGGFRSADATEALLQAVDAMRADLIADIRVQIRLETHVVDEHPRLLAAVKRYGVDYVVFNNHLAEALEMAQQKPQRFAGWAAQQGRHPRELLTIVEQAQLRDAQVPQALCELAARLGDEGVTMGSHDDGDAAVRGFFRSIGAPIAEFPTTVAAARSARKAGEPVLMGAPNVVRGGSQSGNIAAEGLIADGLCDALVSDYYYPALSQAAWSLADKRTLGFGAAWEMISTRPAAILGLTDRGRLAAGQRADLVVMNPDTQSVEATISGGRLAFAQGRAGRQLLSAGAA